MHGIEDRLDRLVVDGAACERAVEIDHVQPLETLLLESSRLGRGVGIEHGRLRHLALAKTHAMSVLQVYGREQDHRRSLLRASI
jgi:hypothetical protein